MIVTGDSRRRALWLASLALLLCSCSKSPAVSGLPQWADLVDDVSASVVNISAVSRETSAATAPGQTPAPGGGSLPDWMRKFLEQHAPDGFGGVLPDQGAEGDAPGIDEPDGPDAAEQSLGSGFILWADGYVVTNAHVVKDAREVTVRLQDRREFAATVVGLDEPSDIALLHIDGKDLPKVKIGDSKKLRVGDWVLAIGSPFGFDYSVTAGIVSAKGRSLFTEQYVPFIQTDAAINPGNSGGPLFTVNGAVVGVNSQIYSQTGGNSGIAFAIPIDVVLRVAEQLKDKGRVTRGWLGVVVQEVTRDLARSFGLAKAEGALVARVVPGSPSEDAGLKPGDVILAFNGEALIASNALPPLVGVVKPGETVPVKVLRDGKQITLKVKIGELPSEVAQGGEPPRPRLPLGLTVQPLNAKEREAAGVGEGGLGITAVEPGPARDAGVRPGDVLLTLAGKKVDDPEKLAKLVDELAPGSSVPLLIQRNGAPLFLALTLPAKADDGQR